MQRPKLKVLQGESAATPALLDFPDVVEACSPHDRGQRCLFRFSRADIARAVQQNLRQPAFDAWVNVFGRPPPVPNVEAWGPNVPAAEGLFSLAHAHACFQGVKRPWAEDNEGENVLAYVLEARFLYRYEPNMVCVARKAAVPEGLLYVVHVRLDQPYSAASEFPRGVVTHGGLVESDPNSLQLPIEHADRYTRRLW